MSADDRDREDADEPRPASEGRAESAARRRPRKRKSKARKLVPTEPARSPEPSIRAMLVGAAAAALVGVALVGTGPSLPGMILVVAGVAGLVVSIHRYGRLGPDAGG